MKPWLPSVLILHNVPRPAGHGHACAESEAGVLAEVEAVASALAKVPLACRAAGVRRLEDLPGVLSAAAEPVVINLVEGSGERAQEANLVPAVCQAFGKACTGGDTASLLLSLDKWRTKAVLQSAGLPVPRGVLVPVGEAPSLGDLPGPYIVKPAYSDASEGIHAASCVFAKATAKLHDAVRGIHEEFAQPALVEQMFGCRELNVSVLQRGRRVEVLPLAEIDFSAFGPDQPRIVDYSAKWVAESFGYRNTPRIIPAPLPEAVFQKVRRLSLAAWAAVGCRDYARVDFRLDEACEPVILEVNVNPDISPDAGFAAALQAAGISYQDFVEAIVDNAAARLDASRKAHQQPQPRQPGVPRSLTVRRSTPRDRDEILAFLAATGFFRPVEMDTAREVLDQALDEGPHGHYQSFTAELDGRAVGWVCLGPTPCTLGTFDVYWIGVAPQAQAAGIGTALMHHAEEFIAERGGRMVVAETSGRDAYRPTHHFYRKLGYAEHARVADFYAPGDDRVIFVKRLPAKP